MKLLFIGNSHTYCNDLPLLVRLIGLQSGVEISVAMLSHGGVGLDFHADQPEVQFNILYGGYDAVILQHDAHPFRDSEILLKAGQQICELISRAKSKAVLYMTWTEQENKSGQAAMSAAYRELGEKTGAAIAPVGEIWWNFIEKHPEIPLYADDGQHASREGSCLAAYVIFSAVTGLKAITNDPIDEEMSRLAYATSI